eukprot:TRINITY_DN54594_c0_g1_i1.p2 TRINITY_DN54594_c0_g1~~TRINITY_DN54594_c0_g1_i1.p2  ORF type:complete len:191 (+),score=34.49 TRINITY_DN54594_c0_g1_i1:65-574(+)
MAMVHGETASPRHKRSAVERRAQRKRAEAHLLGLLAKGTVELAEDRGGAASNVVIALSTTAAATGKGVQLARGIGMAVQTVERVEEDVLGSTKPARFAVQHQPVDQLDDVIVPVANACWKRRERNALASMSDRVAKEEEVTHVVSPERVAVQHQPVDLVGAPVSMASAC